MADDFVQQIARLLGQSPEDTHRTLHALADSIREEVENTGAAQIDGLGTFRRDGDALAFDPAPALARAVNHRYAGLPTLESDSATADAPTDETPDAPTETPTLETQALDAGATEAAEATEAETVEMDDPFAAADEALLDLEPEAMPEPVRDLTSEPEPEPDLQAEAGHDDELGMSTLDLDDTLATDQGAALLEGLEADALGADTLAEDHAPEAEAGPDAPDLTLGGAMIDEDALADSEMVSPPASSDDEIDTLLEGVWSTDPAAGDTPHPLGAPPPDHIEDADYAVLGDADDVLDDADEPVVEASVPAHALADDVLGDEQVGDEPDDKDGDLDALFAGLATDPTPVAQAPPEPPTTPDTPAPAPAFAATSAAAKADEATPSKKREPRERSGSRMPLVLGIAAVLLAALAIFWLINREPDTTVAERTPATEPAPPSSIDPATPEATDPEATGTDATTLDAVAPATPEPEPAPPLASADPLRSAAGIDRADGGFSWVVGSELSRAPAERRVAAFREQGFRADVIAEEAAGRTRYRVAIGQFDSIAEAEGRRADLPAGVPADTWLLRL